MHATRTISSDTCVTPQTTVGEPARNTEYAHLEPLLAEYAGLEPGTSRHQELRDQLVLPGFGLDAINR